MNKELVEEVIKLKEVRLSTLKEVYNKCILFCENFAGVESSEILKLR